jgi:hypothetical protein
MLHPQLTKRIWADEKYSPLTTVVPEDHHSFVSRSWDAILDFLFDKTKKNNDAFFFFSNPNQQLITEQITTSTTYGKLLLHIIEEII